MKLFIFMLIVFITSCNTNSIKYNSALEGQPMQDFPLFLTDSITSFNVRSIPDNKPILLFYFEPDCIYCRAQLSDIKKDIDQLRDVNIIMITSVQFHKMKSYYDKNKLFTYKNIRMGLDYQNKFTTYNKPKGFPYLVSYNKDKILTRVFPGRTSIEEIKKALY